MIGRIKKMNPKARKIFQVSDLASLELQNMISKESKKIYAIKIGVKKKGCSGLSYYMEYLYDQPLDEALSYIKIDENENLTFLIDKPSLMYIIGTEMNYIDSEFKTGFEFKNPNEKGRCGCGESFTT